MEVFNTSGESGMAVIHMDDKQAVRLKFQYRINISIVYQTQDTGFDLDPPHYLDRLHRSGGEETYPPLNQSLVDFGLTCSPSTANSCASLVVSRTNDFSSIERDKMVTAPDYTNVSLSSSTFVVGSSGSGSSISSAGNTYNNLDCTMAGSDIHGLLGSSTTTREANVGKYKLVRENLNDIFRKRTSDSLINHPNTDVKMEENVSCDLMGEEEEGDVESDYDKGHGNENESNFLGFHETAHESCDRAAGGATGTQPDSGQEIFKDDSAGFDIPCSVCQRKFENTKALEEHQAAPTAKIKCLVCKEECLSRAHLMLHDYSAHTPQGKLKKECPVCREPYSNASDLVDHIKFKHTHEGAYKCCLCQKIFQTENEYKLHANVCMEDKKHRKLIKSNKKLSTNVNRKTGAPIKDRKEWKSGLKAKRKGERSENDSMHKLVKKSSLLSNEQTSKVVSSSPTKIKITFKKQDKATAKLKKAKLNAQYYQKLKQQRLLKKQREAEEKAANGDDPSPVIIIEKVPSAEGTDSSWDKTWKCKFCDRIFMNMREFNCHNMPMRTKRVCTKCGDRSKSKAEYLLHQCKRDAVEQEDGEKAARGKRKCPVCQEEVAKKEILKHVMFQHTGELPHLCCICGVPLDSYESWISHCETFHAAGNENNADKNRLFSHVSYTNNQNSNDIVCKLCKSHFCSEKEFVHHHKFETVRKVCNVCETPTYTEAGYIVHQYLSHGLSPDNYSLPIPSCYDGSNNNLWEEDRFSEWSNEGLPCVKCPCCPSNVNTKDLLFHVMEMHTRESPFKCCACEEVLPTMQHYIQHCDFHLGKRMYNNKTPRCLQCDLRFESRRALNSHKQFHQKRCPYCQMEFSSAVFLKIHLQNYHTNEMEACSFCGKLFACSTQLAEHERHHYFSKQSQCTVCGKLIFARNMAKHMKIAHPKSDDDCFFCTVCNKRFRDRHQMEQHQLCHSTNFTHECDVCKKKFKNGIRLREHAKVHLEKKRLFVCDICGKTCTEKYNLQVHMRVHSNTKEFHCPLCNQGFNYNQSLKSHMEKEHNKVSVGPQHFNCSFCNIPFGYVHTLEAHMREKHGYSATNYGPASQWY